MGFFSGFAGKFGEELGRSRAEEADRAERQSALESQILQHLSTSPDPEIASHAITGLLDLAGPQKKAPGLSGWLGKVAAHPALPTIRQLVSSGRQVEDQPPQAPRMNVEEGLSALPGVPASGAPPAAAAPPMGPPSPDQPEPVPSAATPPPSAPFAQGFQPATTKTVPRHVVAQPGELEAQQAGAKETAVLTARGAAYDKFAGTPGKQSIVPGVNNPPAPHAEGEWQDPTTKQWYKQELITDQGGTRTLTRTPISKVEPRPTGPEAQLQARSAEILATNPGFTPEQATQQAQVEARAATIAKAGAAADAHLVRLGQIQAMVPATIAAWQRVNGTVPMTLAQAQAAATSALSAARQTLGAGPEVTPEDITSMAKGLMVASDTRRGPTVSPTRAALAQPAGGPPAATPPPGAPNDLTATIPEHLRTVSVHPDKAVQTPAQIQTQQRQATKVLSHVATLQQEIEQIDQMGLMGPIGGRWGAFLAGGVGTLGGSYTPEQARLLAKFRTDMGLLKSGMAMVHGGARGGGSVQMMARMDSLISADKMDKNLLLGATDAFKDWLTEYAKGTPDTSASGTAPAGAPPAPGGRGGTAPTLPPAVEATLKAQGAGRYTLKNGQIWVVDAAGNVRPGG